LALIAVTLFPSDQRARATTAQSNVWYTSSRFYTRSQRRKNPI
jgi:hypothetical protein